MNYTVPDIISLNVKKAIKCLTVFFILAAIAFATIYFSKKTSSQTLPDCTSLSGNPVPGVNCLYFGFPLCTGSTTDPRVNCANIIDLPLCSQIKPTTDPSKQLPGKNCVLECNSPVFTNPNPLSDPALKRGIDYAVHNKDCIRFCDDISDIKTDTYVDQSSATPKSGVNCVPRKCHQLPSSVLPISSGANKNCDLLPCNLLTPDELNDTKFETPEDPDDGSPAPVAPKYCEGDNLKCYQFTAAQLPYLRVREVNTMCKIHDCKPSMPSCGADDALNILNKDSTYQAAYQKYINGGFSLDTSSLCHPVSCLPVAKRKYICSPPDNGDGTTRNPSCDASGDGSVCNSGYCYKTIDCNLPVNSKESECSLSPSAGSEDKDVIIGSTDDTMSSWFYRPKPMAKSTYANGILLPMESKLCYNKSQMKAQHWGTSVFLFGYFHDPFSTRSPGMCRVGQMGLRGPGYLYLCGVGVFDNKADEETAFHSGYVKAQFAEGDATYQLNVCLRFDNLMQPSNTCGSRECGILCVFGWCMGQFCGYDKCRTLTVKDSETCKMSQDLPNRMSCMTTVDGDIRLRAVKYGNKICTFLDVKGEEAYDHGFFNGTEKLDNNTCFSGNLGPDGSCVNGFNTNNDKGSDSVWRTVLRIPYIKNNRPDGKARGYLDKDGRLFPEQDCIKVPLRVHPPRTYNLATIDNSLRLFSPPLYIANSRTIRGGPISVLASGDLGPTDFHEPEVEVRFGDTTKKLGLSFGLTGYEGNLPSYSYASIITTVNATDYAADVFVRKEFDASTYTPQFCLYRVVVDAQGIPLNPIKIQCVNRNLPEIDNKALKAALPSLNARKIIAAADPDNKYDNSSILIKYLGSFGANNQYDNCTSDDSCTAAIKLSNPNSAMEDCNSDTEQYKICVKREDCTQINNECIKNEVNLQNAKSSGADTSQYLDVRRNCNDILLPMCNRKKGITDPNATIMNQNPSGTAADPKAYGWFNELCISSGFDSKLKTVLAYKTDSGVMGKCIISSSVTNPDVKCPNGGREPDCPCQEIALDTPISDNQVIRKQTYREAGLCIDMPLAKTCPAVDYNLTPNPDQKDPDYTYSSVNNTDPSNIDPPSNSNALFTYNNISGVHISHQYRTFGKAAPNAIPLKGHAEFPSAVAGMIDVEGECKGFWKDSTSSTGISIKPKMNCLEGATSGTWEGTTRNQCVRYFCPQITTTGPDASGLYQNNYGINETGENKGLSNGFAIWPLFTKTDSSDFPEVVSATGCIDGFKKIGSSPIIDGTGLIAGYSGGNSPTRYCSQTGQWVNPKKPCQRITCSAVNPAIPTGSGDTAAWNAWYNSGGATFPSINASRSPLRIQPESVATGTCNNDLGFFQAPGGQPPTRECDSLGNWGPVKNPCVTQCSAVSNFVDANNMNNGFAYWLQADIHAGGWVDGTFAGCIEGYIQNPYPPTKDKFGNDLPSFMSNNINRAAEVPQRICQSVVSSQGFATNVWGSPSSSCINQCPGADLDPRIGVGITTHMNTYEQINVKWPSTDLGKIALVGNPDPSNQNASNYSKNSDTDLRTNGYYLLSRKCNTNGKWDDPLPQCATNGGTIGDSNATYSSPTNSVGEGIVANGTCMSGYTSGLPSQYTCTRLNARPTAIDQFYYKKTGGASCAISCQINNNQTLGNGSIFLGQSGSLPAGYVIKLSCQTGYGGSLNPAEGPIIDTLYDVRLVGDPFHPPINDCGRSAAGASYYIGSDRSASKLPYAICQADRTWKVYNDCSKCRDCNENSYKSLGIHNQGIAYYGDLYADGACDNIRFVTKDFEPLAPNSPHYTIAHNQTVKICRYLPGNNGCSSIHFVRGYLNRTCIDGSILQVWQAWSTADQLACDGTYSVNNWNDTLNRHAGEQIFYGGVPTQEGRISW